MPAYNSVYFSTQTSIKVMGRTLRLTTLGGNNEVIIMKKGEFFKDALPDAIGPLEGIKVIEATHYGAGPIIGTLLGDLGAEVIKCDPPKGDMIRKMSPFVTSEKDPVGESAAYLSLNRNKKNITLNLQLPEGQEVFKEIVRRMEIDVVEHPTLGKLPLYGIGPKFSLTPGKIRLPAPMLGQHNEEIYRGVLGFDQDKLKRLKEKGII